jgi:hypothetical protein
MLIVLNKKKTLFFLGVACNVLKSTPVHPFKKVILPFYTPLRVKGYREIS